MNKIERIKRKSENGPEQRTVEWLRYRNMRIGGSEMHNICKLSKRNINSFINNFLYNKIDRKNMFIAPCEFGNLFENEIHKYTERRYKTEIYEFNVIQYDKSKYVCYSCDGIGIVDNKIILFEFKCPYSRIPSDKIKYDYQCQINTGLNVIRECDKCYYCEGEFKKCKIDDLYNYNGFDKRFHEACLMRDFNEMYVTYGIIYIYIIDANEKENEPIDIGLVDKYKFMNILNEIYKKRYKIVYFSDLVKDKKMNKTLNENESILPYNNTKRLPNEKIIKELRKVYEGYIKEKNGKVIGYLPWKLYNYNKIEQEKKSNFFDEHMISKILYIGYILNYTKTIEDIDEKKEYILKNKENIECLL
jgi:hypothetical protein